MKTLLSAGIAAALMMSAAAPVQAQELLQDTVTYARAEVLAVVSETTGPLPGTTTTTTVQVLRLRIVEGEAAGKVMELENSRIPLVAGDTVYVRHAVNVYESIDVWSVGEPYRLPVLGLLVGLFIAVLAAFGGKQGLRGLLALTASFFFIGMLLLPGILHGYSPLLLSLGVSALIIILGSYVTHGFNRTTSAAVVGMLLTIAVTGALALWSISAAHLTGFSSEEAVYLNFDTGGAIDFVGLLLGGVMIGLLGVLYDAGIGQAVAVEELLRAGIASRTLLWRRAVRIGREHIGALVNTLAIAYVGASLPMLLLLRASSTGHPSVLLNQELFASELVRIMIGSIGLILAVPITTAVAVYLLHGRIMHEPGHHPEHRH